MDEGPRSNTKILAEELRARPRSRTTNTCAALFANAYPGSGPFLTMHNDCITVDELILEIVDYKNNYAEVAVEKLKRLCSQSYGAYDYLQDRVHDAWLPDYARNRLRDVLLSIDIHLHAFQEYGR